MRTLAVAAMLLYSSLALAGNDGISGPTPEKINALISSAKACDYPYDADTGLTMMLDHFGKVDPNTVVIWGRYFSFRDIDPVIEQVRKCEAEFKALGKKLGYTWMKIRKDVLISEVETKRAYKSDDSRYPHIDFLSKQK